MLDSNLAADKGKFDYVARLAAGEDALIDLIRKGEPLEVLQVRDPDLCLLRRPDARSSSLWDLVFEFKRIPVKELKMSRQKVSASPREELMKLAKVKDALDEAEGQIVEYEAALTKSRGDTLKLRSYAVALGFERLVARSSPTYG